ncbi:hypothetical protein Bca52824_084378 [Brassica carinata]|uniref:Uncharacterized protein n=1 Tax=Brassica carinata TaxID=52824 RepID=A0A8X7PNK5_BRACI|nr:hypothetical protein Bca52824_084378 [Brassica carinata]
MVADEDDIRCLRGTQTFITDPQEFLNHGTLQTSLLGSSAILSCWNNKENIVDKEKEKYINKPLVKVRHGDLMAAPNGFSSENVIFYTRTWTRYKALLLDGSALAVKHLWELHHLT